MPRFSANLGFLWKELSLLDAIESAANAGFNAVECHWPYDIPAGTVKQALDRTGLPMIGINTRRGNVDAGDNGVAAIPGRETEAREYIDESITYAAAINCANVHVMAGITDKSFTCESTYRENLRYACQLARSHGVTILIEPLNHFDAPGYHLSTIDGALDTMSELNEPNLKVMFDCYHIQIMHGDLTRKLQTHLSNIGHIQIAAVPCRSEPDRGELHYPNLLQALDDMGWSGYVGAEYKPCASTESGLHWLEAYQ